MLVCHYKSKANFPDWNSSIYNDTIKKHCYDNGFIELPGNSTATFYVYNFITIYNNHRKSQVVETYAYVYVHFNHWDMSYKRQLGL